MDEKKLFNIKETMTYLGLSYSSVKQIFAAYPELICFKFGRTVFTSKERLDRYIKITDTG